jgi:2,3-bisphosphoglycerate-independent phosphoglycerate mutase
MKYIMLVPDGAADDPLAELDGRTPLEAARTPNLDRLAAKGRVGSVLTVPEGMYPGSDVANMSLMGYDPKRYYTGRGPIEAAALDVPLEARDVAFRCSLVSTDGVSLLDYSSGHVSTEEARVLMALVQEKFGSRRFTFFPGVQYRHILRWTDGQLNLKTVPPHDIQGKPLAPNLPLGDGEDDLRRMIFDSLELLDDHPVNRRRRDEGKMPANTLWPWGQGRATVLPSFTKERNLSGAVITAVDLVRGLGRCASMRNIDVPGATGYIDTNYRGKADYCLTALDRGADFLYLHIESPDESGHEGNIEHKVRSIEDIDSKVVGPLIEGFAERKEPWRLMVVPDHATPIALRTHRSGPVPFLLYDSANEQTGRLPYDERALEETRLIVDEGNRLIDLLLASSGN